MPFDGTVVDAPKPLLGTHGNLPGLALSESSPPPKHRFRRAESIASTLAVLTLARGLIAEERRWCKGAFARSWFDIPVRARSGVARRYCVLGAMMRAGYELSLGVEDARVALEWQVGRHIQDWNDDPVRTHADVIAAFDAALVAVETAA